MRIKFVFLLSVCICLAVSKQSAAQWKQSPHKFDNGVVTLAYANNGTLYASTSMDGMYGTNIFTSADGGITWKPLNPQLPSSYATTLFISASADGGQYLFACTQYTIYRLKLSSAGAAWVENHDILESVSSMCQTKKYGKNIYAAAGGSGLFRSENNGDHWVNQNFVAPDQYNPVKFTKITATDSNYYVATTKGLFVSTGVTSGDFSGTDNAAIAQLVVAGKNLFAFSYSTGLRTSADNGKSWTTASAGLENCKSVYCLCATKSGSVFAGTDHGVFWFDKANQTWKQESQGLPESDTNVWSMVVAGSKLEIYSGGSIWYRLITEIK